MSSFKSEIAPKGLQFYPSDFFISDKYATIITVVSYPKFITPGYLSNYVFSFESFQDLFL